MNISKIISHLENLAPKSLQESYDNSGLIVGDQKAEASGVLVCLDSIEATIDEAIERNCNLVVAHHPILFSGLKSITGKNYIERTLLKAIKNDIAIYAIHTNLDNVIHGVNKKIADKVGLRNCRILAPKKSLLKKLVFFCPKDEAENVKQAIFEAGAGTIGNYDHCSFNIEGLGTFRAGKGSNPYLGKVGELSQEEELRVETVFPHFKENSILNALLKAHPYEEVAYDLYPINNQWNQVGSGIVGELEKEMDTNAFLKSLKLKLKSDCIRHTKITQATVKRIAICGGSGSFLLPNAIAQAADLFITADFKYHQFFDADNRIVIADVGHYESEQYTAELILEYLQEKIPNFAVHLTKINTNPINYI